jgi:hypothetical protein
MHLPLVPDNYIATIIPTEALTWSSHFIAPSESRIHPKFPHKPPPRVNQNPQSEISLKMDSQQIMFQPRTIVSISPHSNPPPSLLKTIPKNLPLHSAEAELLVQDNVVKIRPRLERVIIVSIFSSRNSKMPKTSESDATMSAYAQHWAIYTTLCC